MKQKTIITELFEDIEKFGWKVVSDKIKFYTRAEKDMLNLSYLKGKIDKANDSGDFEQYYNNNYGEEESN